MDIHGFFTQKGLLLAAKLAAGSTLKYTRACAGAAETALSASALSQIRQTLSMGAARRSGETAVLPVTLEAGMAGSAYTLKEVGLYAQDPDEGEILYKVYRLTEPVQITPSSRLVLRFYLEETVSQDLNVTVVRASAGLLTEADLDPIHATLEATHAPSRTVEVAAAELPAYIRSLPRLLTEALTIEVLPGTAAGDGVKMFNFYGPGSLTVMAKTAGKTVIENRLDIRYCGIPITVDGFALSNIGGMGAFVHTEGSFASVSNCSIDCSSPNSKFGAFAIKGSVLCLTQCSITNAGSGLGAETGGKLAAIDCTGENNTVGVQVRSGGIILLNGTTPDDMGGSANRRYGGGLIVKADGTLVQ